MSEELITRIVIALSTVSGSAVVGGLALYGAKLSHLRTINADKDKELRTRAADVERESRERTAAIEKEGREREAEERRSARGREEAAAVELDQLFSQLGRLKALQLDERLNGRDEDKSREQRQKERDELAAAQDAVQAQLAFLPARYRQRFSTLLDAARWADELGVNTPYGEGWHYESCHSVVRGAVDEAHEAASSFLRHDPNPPGSSRYETYALAVAALIDDKRNEFAMEIHEEEEAKREWALRFPSGAHLIK